MLQDFSRCHQSGQQSASFLLAPCQDDLQAFLIWHFIFIQGNNNLYPEQFNQNFGKRDCDLCGSVYICVEKTCKHEVGAVLET